MAWIGIFTGMLTGLLAAGLACAGLGLPLWAGVLLYPVVGTSAAVLVILLLVLREAGGGTSGRGAIRPAPGRRAQPAAA